LPQGSSFVTPTSRCCAVLTDEKKPDASIGQSTIGARWRRRLQDRFRFRIRSNATSLATDRIYVNSRLIRTKALLRARAQTTLTWVSVLSAHRAIRTLAGLIWQQLRIRFRVEWIQLPALFRGDQLRLHLGARNGCILGCIRSAGGLCKDRCRRHCGCEQQATDKSTFHDQPLHSDRGDTRCIAYMKQSIHEPIDDQ
jgi:hypothetical protein